MGADHSDGEDELTFGDMVKESAKQTELAQLYEEVDGL